MKLTILLSSAILFATAATPISAYADDSNLMCRRSNCDSRGAGNGGKLSISGLDINVKSSGNVNRKRDSAFSRDSTVVDGNTENNIDNDNSNTADVDNNNDNNNDNVVDANNGTDNDTDPVVDNNNDNPVDADNDTDHVADNNNSNNSPPQLNSNDIKGFDPFGGLYGPGT